MLSSLLLVAVAARAALAQVPAEPANPVDGAVHVEAVPAAESEPETGEEQSPAPDLFLDALNRELGDRAAADDATAGTPAQAPGSGGGTLYYLRVFSAFCFVLFLVIFAGYVSRRVARRTPLLAGQELGDVLGRLYLSKNATLHFVRSGGRILVIGVSNDSMSLITQFDAEKFESEFLGGTGDGERGEFDSEGFVEHLKRSEEQMRKPDAPVGADPEDREIASLRGDIQRLQDFLRHESGGRTD